MVDSYPPGMSCAWKDSEESLDRSRNLAVIADDEEEEGGRLAAENIA